jgi:hypothetical protein
VAGTVPAGAEVFAGVGAAFGDDDAGTRVLGSAFAVECRGLLEGAALEAARVEVALLTAFGFGRRDVAAGAGLEVGPAEARAEEVEDG